MVVEWLIREDGHRLDVTGLKMGKQLVEVWDVEPATGEIGALNGQGEFVKYRRGGMREEEQTHDFALEWGV